MKNLDLFGMSKQQLNAEREKILKEMARRGIKPESSVLYDRAKRDSRTTPLMLDVDFPKLHELNDLPDLIDKGEWSEDEE